MIALVGNSVGLTLIVTAWWTTSGARSIPQQLAWLNIGIAGLILGGLSNLFWLGEGRRVLRRERISVPLKTRVRSTIPASHEQRVTVAGTLRYHRRGCVLVRGKAVTVSTGNGSIRACEVCRP
jgi:hypothetical protein